MPIKKSYMFGVSNSSPWDTKSQLKFKLLTPGSDELKKVLAEKQYRALARAVQRDGLKLSLPDELVIEEIAEEDVRFDRDQEWRSKLGRVSSERLTQLERKTHWTYKADPASHKDASYKDAALGNTSHKDAVLRDASHKDAALRDPFPRDPAARNGSRIDSVAIKNRAFKRFVFTVSSKGEKNFHVLLVDHLALNGDREGSHVGKLVFVITPELDPFS